MPTLKPRPKYAHDSLIGERNYGWKGDNATDKSKRKRARKRFVADICERCGSVNSVERHHKDSNPGNNDPSNIGILCRRCHMDVDGRLELLAKNGKRDPLPPRPCKTCKCLTTVFRHGECHKCNEYHRRNGITRPASSNCHAYIEAHKNEMREKGVILYK